MVGFLITLILERDGAFFQSTLSGSFETAERFEEGIDDDVLSICFIGK